MLGGEGKYTYFTSLPLAKDDPSERNVVVVAWDGQNATTELQGPLITRTQAATQPLTLRRAGAERLSLTLGDAQPVEVTAGRWTALLRVCFTIGLQKVHGLVKFMLVEAQPNLRLVASPIHLDAAQPAFQCCCPACFGAELQKSIGPFHTLGMPEQIHPLSHERYDYEAFLSECRTIMAERRQMLRLELSRFERGVLAFVFDTSDRIQHAFWSMRDTQHPAYDPELARKYAHVIPDMYREMDDILGEVLAKADADTALIVVSDHGFNSFRRAVHLNRWLIQNGYMTLTEGQGQEGGQIFKDVDWSHTKAYALGFASLYLNLAGREGEGLVPVAQAPALAAEIAAKLKDFKDPDTGVQVCDDVYLGREIYAGAVANEAPDLVVGYRRTYRASWQTALGGAPLPLVEDNKKRWSGDHLIDPKFVPGILFCNRPVKVADPRVEDIAPTVLHCLGLQPPPHMTGRPLF